MKSISPSIKVFFLGNNPIFDSDCYYDGELKIAAVINKYGVTDLVPIAKMKSKKRWLGDRFDDQEFTESVSPLYYVSKNSPPVFIAHGVSDTVVPYSQSVKLYNALQKCGVATEFLTIPNAGHGMLTEKQNTLFRYEMWKFLKNIF